MWRERMRGGRFRDADFLLDSHDLSSGRQAAKHQYPKGEKPYAEDMGKRQQEFSIECHVIGADYMAARDALIAALEKEGPGTLVHPYLGTRRVQVLGFRLRESSAEGGIARFSIRFVEAGQNLQPRASADTSAIVGSRADAAITAIAGRFAERFDVSGPEFVAADATSTLQRMSARLDALAGSIPADPAGASAFARDLGVFSGSLASLIRTPASLAGSATSLIGALAGLTARPEAALGMYRGLFNFGDTDKPLPRTTPNRRRQARNRDEVNGMVRRAAIVEAARAASGMRFEAFEDATAVRDELADRLDAEMDTAPDDVYQALAELRAALVQDIRERGVDLARIVSVVPPATLPALVLAHRIHGDPKRVDEVVVRNRIRHPGFVPGGMAIEVLSDA